MRGWKMKLRNYFSSSLKRHRTIFKTYIYTSSSQKGVVVIKTVLRRGKINIKTCNLQRSVMLGGVV